MPPVLRAFFGGVRQVRDGGSGVDREDPVRGSHGAPRVASGGAVQQAPPRAGEDSIETLQRMI